MKILITGCAGFKSADRLGTLQSCQWRTSDINNVQNNLMIKEIELSL